MSYKWTSGSVRRGDIYFEDDRTGAATYIDFGEDTITLRPSASAILFAESDKVGIGTTSPTYTLDVVGDIGIDSLLRHNDDSNTYLRFLDDGFDVVVGGVKSINCDPSATRINAQNVDHDFVVQTSGSPGLEDAFFVEGSSGKVGIGTDTPTAVLHVSGSDAATLFSVRSDSNIDLFTVTGSGQVGIGTNDPQATLHVKAAVSQFRVEDTTVDYAYTVDCDGAQVVTHFGDLTDGESGKDAFMSFGAYGGINRLDTTIRDFHLYGTRTTVGFYFDESSGSFGFGTDTPTAVLHVSGSDAAALFSVRSDSNIDLFTVTGSGQVGIGTPDPKIALDVHDDPTSLEDDTGGGMVIKFGGGTVAKGKLYFLHTDGNWTATDSSAVATGADQLLAISLGTDAAVDGMLIRGFFDADTELDNFSAGKAAYVSETASKMDTTAPTTADAFVRIVGYCTDQSNVIYFNPSGDWVELG